MPQIDTAHRRLRSAAFLLSLALLAALAAYAATGGDIVLDHRIADAVYPLRSDAGVAVMGWITRIGGRHGVLPLLAGATVALLLLRRSDLLAAVWVAALGNLVSVTLLKAAFDRPRPAMGYFIETSGSFPSGHAAGAIAVWAMLWIVSARLHLIRRGPAIAAAVLCAVVIGGTRIYLGQHYLTDILGGYLLGGLWLTAGLTCAAHMTPRPTAPRHRMAATSMAAAIALAVILASTLTRPVAEPEPTGNGQSAAGV
ncbi:undecaprenyl-diphosphatase [Loktanella fryxellensis]|uniref:Undecaprenyl-diphosphatase n=1 Tax=Loktanella fryxellensis TaxID=245187 RepID=A0A1H8DPU7_9RHOB|nr:phosphatase PAP2 family protein [Loktanella fryxellensis]SEN09302.1 undecaprenyl-diphosphatase [Loktanella fryxellensis]